MKQIITFTSLFDESILNSPEPSKNHIPEWYKKTKEFTKENTGPSLEFDKSLLLNTTIKKCLPVFDAITFGYIAVSDVDIYVDINSNKEQVFIWPSGPGVDSHLFLQAEKHPEANKKNNFPRWQIPWSVSTPNGYSCLFIPPMHRDNVFEILPGVVDTDQYPMQLTFPFIMKDKKFKGVIPQGTPIAQIIPFKRDSWKMEFGNEKMLNTFNKKEQSLSSLFLDRYKRLFWKEKQYD
jgi:hypothetical protein